MPFALPADIEREERLRVAKRKPWLALASFEPKPPKKPEPDFFQWREVAELLPVGEE